MDYSELFELKKGDMLWSNIGLGTAVVTTGRRVNGRQDRVEVEVRRQFGDKSKFRLSFVSVDLWRRTEEPEEPAVPIRVRRVRSAAHEEPHVSGRVRRSRK